MKRATIVVLVVALLAGLGYIGFSSQAAAKPKEPTGEPTRLVEIFTDQLLDPEAVPAGSDWFDVTNYRKFKLLVRLTPAPEGQPGDDPPPPPTVNVNVAENPAPPDPGPNPGAYGSVPLNNYGWGWYPMPNFDERWAMSPDFEGLYSNIRITALDFSGESKPPADQYSISIYLLMAEE